MRILELTLLTRDVRRLRSFYADRLGLACVAESATSATLRVGDTHLTFASAGPGRDPVYHYAFNVVPDLFDLAVEWIAARAPIFTDAESSRRTFRFPAWDADAVYFADPAGNVVELIARHHLDARGAPVPPRGHAAGSRFGPEAILSVSEIGLPVEHVRPARHQLATFTESAPWGAPGESFAALGDDHGLLIVVERARAWFPTTTRADVFPIALTVSGRRDRRFRLPGTPYLVTTRAR